MNEGARKLKQSWNENPVGIAIVASALFASVAKLIDAVSGIQSRRAYAVRRKAKR